MVLVGCFDIASSRKAARFVHFCDAFNIPIIKHGAKLLYAYAEATVPKITLALRKEYGGAVMAMCCVGMGVDMMLAWPIAKLVVLDTTTAVNLIFRKDIQASEDPEEFRNRMIKAYDEKYSNPFHAASNMLVDSVIEPRKTRPELIKTLQMLKTKNRPNPFRRHGNIPL